MQVLFMLFAFAVAGWGIWQLWQYRLPQVRDFADSSGHTVHATILARNDEFVELLLPDSTTPRYFHFGHFSTADQEFLHHTKAELVLKFPLDYVLTTSAGGSLPVRLEARDDHWVKITDLSSQAQTCLPLDQLVPADREFVSLLPSGQDLFFPIDYVLTGPPQPGAKIHFLGRTANYAEFKAGAAPVLQALPLAGFSAADQNFLRHLPVSLAQEYPVEYPLTSSDGRLLPRLILDHNFEVVALQLPTDGSTRYYPIARLAEDDRNFFYEIPGHLTLACPLDCTIADNQGQTSRVRVLARSTEVLKLAGNPGAPEQFLPLASLSVVDQEVFRQLPVSFSFSYPFDCTLVDQSGRAVSATILGHTDREVRFRAAGGNMTAYPLEKLSTASQQIIRLLPLDSPADAKAASPVPAVAAPAVDTRSRFAVLRDSLLKLLNQDDAIRRNLDALPGDASPGDGTPDKTKSAPPNIAAENLAAYRNTVVMDQDDCRDQIEKLCLQINALLPATAKSGGTLQVKNTWDSLMLFVRADDQLRQGLTASNNRQADRNQIRKNQVRVISLLGEIKDGLNLLTPSAAP